MKHIDTVIFDLDGTLLDTIEDLALSVNHALRLHGLPERSLDEVRNFVGNGVRELMKRAVFSGEVHPEFETIFADFKSHYVLHANDHTGPYEGVCELLKTLKEMGYAVAIVSNKLDQAVQDLKERYFKEVVTVAVGDRDGILRKPAPDMVELALRELGKKKETAVYVGDSEVDIATAKAAKMPCISVGWGFREKEFLFSKGAAYYIETPEELLSMLSVIEKTKTNRRRTYYEQSEFWSETVDVSTAGTDDWNL